MNNKIKLSVLALAMALTMPACANNNDNKEETNKQESVETTEEAKTDEKEAESKDNTKEVAADEAKDESKEESEANEASEEKNHDFSDKLNGEDGVVRWVRGHSGNLMMTMAEHNGYLEEYGLKVDQIPMQTKDESFAAVAGNQVDIVSNAGTNEPLQRIAKGDDLQIFGGHMVEGAMNLIALKETPFEDMSSLVGKKLADNSSDYVVSGLLLEMGYNPLEDVNWVHLDGAEAITALKNKEVDYAMLGTSLAYQAKTDPSLKIVAKKGVVMDKYSCCRMETASRFIDEKPETTKALIKALLRGMRDFEKDPETASNILADELDVPIEFIEAYTLDEGYEINPDPLYNSCVRAWAYLDELGFLDENSKNIDLRDHIRVDLYKQALEEVIEEVGDEDPEYWNAQLEYFNENNSMYFDKSEEDEYYKNLKNKIEENKEKNQKNN